MHEQTQTLRESLEQSRVGQGRWRCPDDLRSKVVAYAKRRRASGLAVRRIAQELGLGESCLTRWLRPKRAGFRPVRVTAASAKPEVRDLVLVTPQGFRLEGLTTSQALRLLREL